MGENDEKTLSDSKKTSQNQPSAPVEEEPGLIELEESIETLGEPTVVPYRKERHAYPLALIIVWTFALSIGAAFSYIFFGGTFSDGVELFKTVSAVLSGPLGFVLGYYFRITELGS